MFFYLYTFLLPSDFINVMNSAIKWTLKIAIFLNIHLSYKYVHIFFQRSAKVAVCGASGGIGQPMSLLLKLNPRISQLALFDIVHTPG